MTKYVHLMATLGLFAAPLSMSAETWSTPAPISTSAQVFDDVSVAYDPATGITVAAWGDQNTTFPTYSIYNPASAVWSSPAALPAGTTVLQDIVLLSDGMGNIYAAWGDNISGHPDFSIFNTGTSMWTMPGSISATLAQRNVFLTYDAHNANVVATWTNVVTNNPSYARYNAMMGMWTSGTITALGTTNSDVYVAYNAITTTLFATWKDSPTGKPFYAQSVVNETAMWQPPAQIAAAPLVLDNVSIVYNAGTGDLLAAWADSSAPHHPYYSIYDHIAMTWSIPAPISTSSSVFDDVNLVYRAATGEIFAAWGDLANGNIPTFSILSGGSWSPAATIPVSSPMTAAVMNLFLTYSSGTNQIITAYGDSINNDEPTFALYPNNNNISGIYGRQTSNNFGIFSERCNTISWQVTTSSGVSGYLVYRNGALIASLGPNATQYEDHNQKKNTSTTYAVATVFTNGSQSSATTITIK